MRNPNHFLLYVLFTFNALYCFGQGRKFAFVVGAGTYPESTKWPATLADRDAERLEKALKAEGWAVFICSSKSGPEQQPTYNNILRFLGLKRGESGQLNYEFTKNHFSGASLPLKPEDQILFHWGGHGLNSPENGVDFIVPLDVILDDTKVQNPDHLISTNKIVQALKMTGAGTIILIIDACRSEIGSLKTITASKFQAFAPIPLPQIEVEIKSKQNLFMIQSANYPQYSHDDPTLGGGVFSYFLNQLLINETAKVEADIDQNNLISYTEGFKYLMNSTYSYVHSMPGKRSEQEPAPSYENVDEADLNRTFTTLNATTINITPENFESWIKSMVKYAQDGFLDIKNLPIEDEYMYSIKNNSILFENIEFFGTYESDFRDRDVVVFRSKAVRKEDVNKSLENLLNLMRDLFGNEQKRHARIYTFFNSNRSCSVHIIHEELDSAFGRLTLEIRKEF